MDAPKAPNSAPALSILPAKFEIVAAEDSGNPLSFVSPPLQDISEMAELERSSFSLNEQSHAFQLLNDGIAQRLEDLSRKEKKFENSSTYQNRIANLNKALGNLEEEARFLNKAASLNTNLFFKRKIGENLIRSGNLEKAKHVFNNLAPDDSYSALRMASLCIVRNDLAGADEWVEKAVELEPGGYRERLFQGAIRLVKGDFPSAIRFLRMALDERPNSSVAYCNLALAYLGDSNSKRAFECLKRSVALDPFNRSAVLALADVGYVLHRDTDVVNSLRYYVEFEQRESAVWGRLARSLLRIDLVDDCIAALKRQGALENSASLWNNLGVAYAKRGNKEQGLQAFKYALTIESAGGSRNEFVVARNIAQLVSTINKPDVLLGITNPLVENDLGHKLARDNLLCDFYGFHISALIQTGERSAALELSNELLKIPDLGESLNKWLVQSLAGIHGVERDADESLNEILDSFLARRLITTTDIGLVNNVAFALIELNRISEAEFCLSKVSHAFHKNQYLTATLGLLNFRKGNVERGEFLYREAIALAISQHDKTRIRQKFNLEAGRAIMQKDERQGRKSLEKVITEKKGERALVRQATLLLQKLDRKF